MNKTRNYYEVLGVQENAEAATIKKRYRELVRKYHPDIAGNKAEAHRMFIVISEAYETLSDSSSRSSYDQNLRMEREKELTRRYQTSQRTRYQANSRVNSGLSTEQKNTVSQHIRNAQLAFIQRRLPTAVQLCKSALLIDPRNASAHSILGDIYKIRGRNELAVKHYSLAVQFNPSDREVERKLSEVLGSGMDSSSEVDQYYSGSTDYYKGRINLISWVLCAGLFVGIRMLPLSTVVQQGNAVYVSAAFNWVLLPVLGIIGFIVGCVFFVNSWLGTPSRDMFSVGRLVKGGGLPLGQVMFWVSMLFFWVAAGIYFWASLLRGDSSRSITRLILATIGILLLAAGIYGNGLGGKIFLWCGNVVFPCIVAGWYCAYVLNPMKRYGWNR